jgi:hypothetical protein
VFQLAGHREAPGVVVVRALPAGTPFAGAVRVCGICVEQRAVPLEVRALPHRDVAPNNAIVLVAVLRVRDQRTDVASLAEIHHLAADVEQPLRGAHGRCVC